MESVYIETTQNVDIEYPIASIGERILAAIIDYFFAFIYILAAIWLIGTIGLRGNAPIIIAMLPFLFYNLIMEMLFGGQSAGKMILKIKVVRLDGASPTFGNFFIRWIARIIDIWIVSGGVAIVILIFNGKGQRLGDIFAGTTVISLKQRNDLSSSVYTEVPEDYQVQFENVYLLNDKDITTIKEVLNDYYKNYKKNASDSLLYHAKEAIEKKLNIESNMHPRSFLHTIIRDYTYSSIY